VGVVAAWSGDRSLDHAWLLINIQGSYAWGRWAAKTAGTCGQAPQDNDRLQLVPIGCQFVLLHSELVLNVPFALLTPSPRPGPLSF
jgi:hypothetical protein